MSYSAQPRRSWTGQGSHLETAQHSPEVPRPQPKAGEQLGLLPQQGKAVVGCAHIPSLKILQSPAWCQEGKKGSGRDSTLPAPLPCYIPSWTKAERSIQYNTYIFHYEIAISFPAFYLMHPELYAAFYITPEGWWGWAVSHARQLLSLEVTTGRTSSKGSLCPGSQDSPSPFKWFLSADP